MTRIRSGLLAVGAAALLSTQAAYAAPRAVPVAVDPLVALSAFGTLQSSASVCAAGVAATSAAGTATTTTAQGTPGCVLPVQAPPPPVAATQGPPAFVETGSPGITEYLPLILGLVGAAIVGAIILSESNDDSEGDLTPVSPQ
jgi:hypothetical protein